MHPDLFGQHPYEQEVNETSLKSLRGFLDSIKNSDEQYPPAEVLRLPFYIRQEGKEEGDFREIVLAMETNGGDCGAVVESKLGRFLAEMGLPSEFDWGIFDWGLLAARKSK